MPRFSHEELSEIWTALQQYCDNCEPSDDSTPQGPRAARSALEKLDDYFAPSDIIEDLSGHDPHAIDQYLKSGGPF